MSAVTVSRSEKHPEISQLSLLPRKSVLYMKSWRKFTEHGERTLNTCICDIQYA